MVNYEALIACAIPNVGGWINGYATAGHIRHKDGTPSWNERLKKPSWGPPGWVFGPVWTSLYTSMGYASYLAYRDGGGFQGDARIPLMLYGTQLVVNLAWPSIFFVHHKLKLSLYTILGLTANAVACGLAFYKINPVAGYLFIPYVGWLCLASTLTYCIARDNPDGGAKIKELKD